MPNHREYRKKKGHPGSKQGEFMKKLTITAIAAVFAITMSASRSEAASLETSFWGTGGMAAVVNVPMDALTLRAGLGLTIPEDSDVSDLNYDVLLGVELAALKGVAIDLLIDQPAGIDQDMEMELAISYRVTKEIANGISLGAGVNLLNIGLTDGTNKDIQVLRGVLPMICVELPF